MKTIKLILLVTVIAFGQQLSAQLKLPFDSDTKLVSYSEVVYVDSTISKKELYDRAAKWVEANYSSAIEGIDLKKEPGEKISVKGGFSGWVKLGLNSNKATIYYTLNISFKDGRCKVQLTNFRYKYCWKGAQGAGVLASPADCREETFEKKINDVSHGDMYKEDWIEFFKKCDADIHSILDNYSEFVQKPAPNEDW